MTAAACGAPVGKLTAAKRKRIPADQWGIWRGSYARSSYPMPDESHAENAKARAKQQLDRGNLSRAGYRKIVAKANKIIRRCKGSTTKDSNMAKTAVVNKRRKTRSDKGKRRPKRRKQPRRYGAAAKSRSTGRRRNPAPLSKYASSGYQRRPNPSMFDVDTWTRIVPSATAGVFIARWAVKMAGPFEPDAAGVPVPGFKHAIAIAIAAEFGGRLVGQMLGGRREIDYAQVAALGYGGDLFLRKRFGLNNRWMQENISLEGTQLPANTMGADTYTDPAGNQYIRTSAGWQLSGNNNQGDWHYGQVELPEDAEPGDIIQTEEGEIFEVMAGGEVVSRPDLGAFYQGAETDAEVAYELEAPAESLPGGGMTGFQESSPLGDFQERSVLGGRRSTANHGNSFGYSNVA